MRKFYYGRPLHMSNAMNVHSGILYLDIPTKGRQTFYGKTGNWFPYLCAAYSLFALISGFFIKKKENASFQQSKQFNKINDIKKA